VAASPDPAGPAAFVAVPASPIAVAVDSRLSDDYLLVQSLSVDQNTQGAPLSVAASHDGTLYQFAILSSQGACEIQATTSGAAAFVPAPLPGGTGASDLATFADSGGVLHAWYVTAAGLAHATRTPADPQSAWSPDTQAYPAVTSLAVSQTPFGDWVVTGLTADGNLLICAEDNGQWSPATVTLAPPMSSLGASARVQYESETSWVLFAADGTGPLTLWQGSGTKTIAGPQQVTIATGVTAAQILFTHLTSRTAMALCSDTDQNVYGSVSYSDAPVPITCSAKVAQAAGAVDSKGMVRLYGSDGNGNLSVLRQTGLNGFLPAWSPMFPLDVEVSYVATPALTGAAPALAAMRADGSLDLLSQPASDGMWARVPVQAPAGAAEAPAQLTRYRTRLSVSGAGGAPAPGTSLALTPSALVALEVAGQTVFASPDASVTLTSDLTGAVEFSQPAAGLDAVTFTVSAAGLAAPATVTPHGYLASQLSGTDPIFTGSATIPPMSATTLQTATLADELLFPSITDAQASVVAQATTSIYAVIGGTSTNTSYALNLQSPIPTFIVNAPPPTADLADSVWDEIGQFFGDVLHAIKQGAITLAGWYADAVSKTITLTIEITEDVTAVLSLISLTEMSVAVSLVHGLFGWLGAPVAKVLDWLKDQLPWADIWNTMEIFNNYIVGGLSAVDGFLEYKAVITTGHFFADYKSTIDTMLNNAITELGAQPVRPPNPALAAMPPITLPGSSTTQNWLLSKLWAAAPGGSLLTDPGDIINTVLTQVTTAIKASGLETDLADGIASLTTFLSDFFSDPGSLSQAELAALLTAAMDLINAVIDAADAIVHILLDMVSDVVTALLTVLNTPMPDVPLLSWLWNNVLRPAGSTEELTLGKLVSLLFAIPVTLMQALENDLVGGTAADSDALAHWQEGCSLILAFIDMTNDLVSATGETNPAYILWNWVDVAANALVNVLFWPNASIFDDNWAWDDMSAGEIVSTVTWFGYWLAICIDGGFTAWETWTYLRAKSPEQRDAGGGTAGAAIAMDDNLNYNLDTAVGSYLMALGTTGAVMQLLEHRPGVDVFDVIEGLLGPLPWATQFILTEEAIELSGGYSPGLQCLIDFFGDVDFG
jgi:hypothetical protein